MSTGRNFKKYLLLGAITIGSSMVILGLYFLGYERTVFSFATAPQPVQTAAYSNATPVRILIPAIKIDQPISEGKIFAGIWQISDKGATHLNVSAVPGSAGNIIVYGHNLKRIFGALTQIHVGDKIDVISQDGRYHSYIVTKTDTVKPNNTAYVEPKASEVLTVYTCTGLFDSMRFMVQAEPVGSSS